MRASKKDIALGAAGVFCASLLAWPSFAVTTDPTSLQADAQIDTPGQIEHCDEAVGAGRLKPRRNAGEGIHPSLLFGQATAGVGSRSRTSARRTPVARFTASSNATSGASPTSRRSHA